MPSPGLFLYGVGVFGVENGQYHVAAYSYGKNYLPTDTEALIALLEPAFAIEKTGGLRRIFSEWKQIARTIPCHLIFLPLTGSNSLSLLAWVSYHDERNEWNHFEKLSRWPNNFICIGDTVVPTTKTRSPSRFILTNCNKTLGNIQSFIRARNDASDISC